jgi:hypothetical protein
VHKRIIGDLVIADRRLAKDFAIHPITDRRFSLRRSKGGDTPKDARARFFRTDGLESACVCRYAWLAPPSVPDTRPMPNVYGVLVGVAVFVSILVIGAIARRSARSSRNNSSTVSRDWLLRHQSQDL